MPGYPLIDQSNDYLMARFDKAVLDAKPWCEAQHDMQDGDLQTQEASALTAEELQLRGLEVTFCPDDGLKLYRCFRKSCRM